MGDRSRHLWVVNWSVLQLIGTNGARNAGGASIVFANDATDAYNQGVVLAHQHHPSMHGFIGHAVNAFMVSDQVVRDAVALLDQGVDNA